MTATRPIASSALVNVAEDAELRLVRLMATPSSTTNAVVVGPSFVSDCEGCIAHGDAVQLMKTIVTEKGAIESLLSLDDITEAISAVSLLAALLDRVTDSEDGSTSTSSQLLTEVSDSIYTATNSDTATKAVALLATLYNMRSDPTEKVRLLVQMIKVATAHAPSLLESNPTSSSSTSTSTTSSSPSSSVLGKWMSDPPRLVAILDEWNIPSSERRNLYRAAAEGIKKTISPTTTASSSSSSSITSSTKQQFQLQQQQQFTLYLVGTYSSTDVIDASGLDAAKMAAIGAIRDPVSLFVQQRTILSLPAIQALGKNNNAQLLALLTVFQEGNLEDYTTFIKSNGGNADTILSQWDLKADDCARYIRILSLCSVAAAHEEIPYSLVATTLQVTPDEVEKWVVAAVSSGLLSAKMDQLQMKVIIERCVVRKFDMEQWKVLQSRLHLWKQNVGGILSAYKHSLEQAKQQPAQQ